MSDQTDAVRETPESDPKTSQTSQEQPEASSDGSQTQEQHTAAPQPTAEDIQAMREADDARIAQIEREIAEADGLIKEAERAIILLRNERDQINARRGKHRAMTQAEAHAAIVATGQAQRMSRAAADQQFQAMTGGVVPSVKTPAERNASRRK